MPSSKLSAAALLAAACCWLSEGYVDVACPGTNSELQCPEGQVIRLQSLGYGSLSGTNCTQRSTPRPLQQEGCLHEQMEGWAQYICDGLQYCRLPKIDQRMFVCGEAADSFLQSRYDCVDRSPGERSLVTCQYHWAKLKCETGLIKIQRAVYGRTDENTCTERPSAMTFCRSRESFWAVRELCDGRPQCDIRVSDEDLGGPNGNCYDSPRYLTVDWSCLEPPSTFGGMF